MQRNISQLTDDVFDLVVVGGGIFGVCCAYDAAQRGLSVAIIERGDFASATSANSLKMVHGGIRYIQHFDIPRIRHSAQERRIMLKVAPHLVRPLPILIPTYGHGMKGKPALRIGMMLYDLLTIDCNRGVADPNRRIPWGSSVSRQRALEMFPGLDRDGLTGGAVFCDGQMYNPTRLVLAFLQNGMECGCVAANYVEALRFLRDGDRITGVAARDVIGGNEFDIRARVVVNAAGPYAEKLLTRHDPNLRLSEHIDYSRDTAFVVGRRLTDQQHAIAVQGTTADPDAKLSRGARHMFIAPWRDYTLVGVWHGVHRDDPDAFTVTDAELQAYIDEINRVHPHWALSLDDVNLWCAGLVPFGENDPNAVNLKYGHRSHLIDHAHEHGIENLITLIGVRYTTGRHDAQRAVDVVFDKLGHTSPRCRTMDVPVVGGDVNDFEALVRRIEQGPHHLPADVARSLAHNYGTHYGDVTALIDGDAQLARRIGGSATIAAQVVLAARSEMAQNLADVVFRRTDLATGEYPGRAALRQCAELLAEPWGWDAARIEREIDLVAARFPDRVVHRVDGNADNTHTSGEAAKPSTTAATT